MRNVLMTKDMVLSEKLTEQKGISMWELMCNAAYSLFEEVKDVLYKSFETTALFICGSSNNAGDGYVCAKYLAQSGVKVSVLSIYEPKSELAKKAYAELCGVENIEFITDIERSFGVCVDCVFGTGFKGSLPQEVVNVFKKVDAKYIVACDVPSGVDCNSGIADENTLKCDITVTFHKAKIGMLLPPANEYCGEIVVKNIGIDEEVFSFDVLDDEAVFQKLPPRFEHSHKGDYGKLLCICGSAEFTGAAALSVKAAMRSGVGLCTLCSTKTVIDRVAGSILESTFINLSEDENGFLAPTETQIQRLLADIKKYDSILIGCGLGKTENTLKLLALILKEYDKTIIIDADGINLVSENIDIIKNTKAKLIFTPHTAELARLCNADLSDVVKNRFEYAKKFAAENNCVVVSKGAGSAIISKERGAVSVSGNSGLSKGGSGDVLAGMIASFSAQGADSFDAACIGTFCHGKCADLMALEISKRSMLARDIIDTIPLLF